MSPVPSLGAVLPQAEIRPSDPRAALSFVEEVERAGLDHLLAFEHVLGADSTARPDWDVCRDVGRTWQDALTPTGGRG